ncbi:MAP7 domain-containing protein 2 isoform X3 [Drosophila tropicalis]|uniref:MAP7 domain-containing protein 2 isoform X3 n=1 Tax=Drosophila tropicalis TaxID=46794 RepID=UPI0035ABB55C
MASLGGQHENYSTNPGVENTPQKRPESREGSAERKVSKDREEKLKYARDRQNEERQRKIEELRAQAEAAQRYREQKEEERRRRIEEIRVRDTEKRHQVEERKKAIIEAEKERREYILKKNLERESRIETKKRDRNSIVFAFGSSTPRLLDVPADYGLVSPSAFWGQRRSTSISNVAAGASLSRRSSERELADSGAKKRASSSTDRHDDHRRKSSSMYEVFNWGYSNDEPPKRYSLSIASSEINIDGPAPPNSNSKQITTTAHRQNNNNNTPITTTNAASQHHYNNNNNSNHNSYRKEDIVDTSPIVFRSVYRRKTDLMPTIPSPRDGHYGSRSSLSTTPARTPGRAYSMNRLDQLAQPIRRNGEHVRAILERERRERELEMLDETSSLGGGVGRRNAAGSRSKRAGSAGGSGTNSATGNMSRSMTHLAGTTHRERGKYSLGGGISTSFRPLGSSGQRDSSSRSGNATPGGHFNNSRPGSAMSTSTTMSTSGLVPRRPATAPRKPRPASIAGTGMSLEEINKLKKDQKPPVKTTAASPSAQTTPKRTANLMSTSLIVTSSSSRLSSAEKKTPSKRDSPMVPKAASASKALPNRTASSERISRHAKESKTKDTSAMTRSMIVTNSNSSISSTSTTTITTTTTATTSSTLTPPALAPAPASETAPYVPDQNGVEKVLAAEEIPVDNSADVTVAAIEAPVTADSKAEKEALNSVKTEEVAQQVAQTVEPIPASTVSTVTATANVEEKADEGTEKEVTAPKAQPPQEQTAPKKPSRSKENSEVRELTPPAPNAGPDGNDLMTASMIARKITTEEEAKAALAERRRLAREEAERQAELERQRLEAERLAELKAQEEEAERQRLFEEESTRLAEEQRRGEEERLRKAIEEAQQREAEEQQKREEEERQRVEREEAEKKAKEEAEKQRVEVAERLKREEKEREERRKRVEAIMSRTRKGGAAATPSKESNDSSKAAPTEGPKEANPTGGSTSSSSDSNSGSSNNSTGGSPSTPAVTPSVTTVSSSEPPNSQAMYEQSVVDKENSLINSFSTMIIDENAKNLQQQQVSNGKLLAEFTTNTPAVANGNGHIENVNNKNDINLLQDTVTPTATQLIDLSIESQQDLHLNNNNSLLTSTAATTTLVTADSHENKDISLL